MMHVVTRNEAASQESTKQALENKMTKLKSRYQQQKGKLNGATDGNWPMVPADCTMSSITTRKPSGQSKNQAESINTSSGSSSGYNSHTQHNNISNSNDFQSQKHSSHHELVARQSQERVPIASSLASQVSQQIESRIQRELLEHEQQKQPFYGYPSYTSGDVGWRQVGPTSRRGSAAHSGGGAKSLPPLPQQLLSMDDKLYFDGADLIDDISAYKEDNNNISQRHYHHPNQLQHLYQFEGQTRTRSRSRSQTEVSGSELTVYDVDYDADDVEVDDDDGYGDVGHIYHSSSQGIRHPQRLMQLHQPTSHRLVVHHPQTLNDTEDALSFSQVQRPQPPLPPTDQAALSGRHHNPLHYHQHQHLQQHQHRRTMRPVEYLTNGSGGQKQRLASSNGVQFVHKRNHIAAGNDRQITVSDRSDIGDDDNDNDSYNCDQSSQHKVQAQHRGDFTCIQPLRSHFNAAAASNLRREQSLEVNQRLLLSGGEQRLVDGQDKCSKQNQSKKDKSSNQRGDKMQQTNSRHSSGLKSDEYQHKSLASRQRQFQEELTRKHLGHTKSRPQQADEDDERPALSICGKFAKFLLFLTNIIFWSTGVALCAWGVLSLVEDHKYNLSQLLVFEPSTKMSLFQLLSWSFITLGCASVLVGFCGCSAMLKNNRWILGLYIFLILAIFALDLATGLLAIIFQERLVANVRLRLVSKLRSEYGVQASFTAAVDYIQTHYECCGLEGHFDYDQSLWRLQRLGGYEATVARTCCHLRNTFDDQAHINPRPVNESMCQSTDVRFHQSYRYRKGCLDDLERLVRHKIWTFTVACGAAGGIILLSLLFSTCFCRSIPNSSGSRKSSAVITSGEAVDSRASGKSNSNKYKKQTTSSNHHQLNTIDNQRHHHQHR